MSACERCTSVDNRTQRRDPRSDNRCWSLPARTSRTLRVGPGPRVLQVRGRPTLADHLGYRRRSGYRPLARGGRERRARRWSRSRDGGLADGPLPADGSAFGVPSRLAASLDVGAGHGVARRSRRAPDAGPVAEPRLRPLIGATSDSVRMTAPSRVMPRLMHHRRLARVDEPDDHEDARRPHRGPERDRPPRAGRHRRQRRRAHARACRALARRGRAPGTRPTSSRSAPSTSRGSRRSRPSS